MQRTSYNPVEQRLKNRVRDDEETVAETIERLLDETVIEVKLETVIEEVMNEFDSTASIAIDHFPSYEEPSVIGIRVYTGEANSVEESVPLFTPDHKIVVERGEERILVPFSIVATYDGPGTYDSAERTTVYMSEDMMGAEPVPVEQGVAYLQEKLADPEQWSNENHFQTDQIRQYSE